MKKPSYKSIVVLTGAGISAESGVATFRANDGLWENHRVEDVATPEAFQRDPILVHQFYNERRAQHEGTRPGTKPLESNAGHDALMRLEKKFPGNFFLVTQNVDSLHERAGSQNVHHMHGELLKMRCSVSGEVFSWTQDCHVSDLCTCCRKAGRLRPHIVWFGETPFFMPLIEQTLAECDLFIAIGTSANVYPAAGFSHLARNQGAHTVELNLEPSGNALSFAEGFYGPGTKVIPKFVEELLGSH